jgi:hypothetical protein
MPQFRLISLKRGQRVAPASALTNNKSMLLEIE